jgi:hypothetical protein
VSDFERSAPIRKTAITPARDEEFDDSLFDQAAADAAPTDGREGLPPTFRMRHDEHYVDQITARAGAAPVQMIAVKDIDGAHPFGARDLAPLVDSISSFGIIQPLLVRRRSGRYDLIAGSKRLAAAIAAGLSEVPCLLQDADDERARALADAENVRCGEDASAPRTATAQAGLPVGAANEIIDSLATIESCLNLFLDRERPLRERVSLELMRAEAHRARWLTQVYTLLAGDPILRRELTSPASLVERALKGLEAEGRLAGVGTSLAVDEFTRTIPVDRRLMSMALTGAMGAMLALLQEADGGMLKVRVSTHPATRLVVFQVAQDIVPAPEVQLTQIGNALPAEWPGDHSTSVGLAAAKRVAELHGGRLEVASGVRGGCSVTLVLPAGD